MKPVVETDRATTITGWDYARVFGRQLLSIIVIRDLAPRGVEADGGVARFAEWERVLYHQRPSHPLASGEFLKREGEPWRKAV